MIRTYAAFMLLGTLWGSNFIYMKWASVFISPGQISLLRVFFGFVPLAILAWRKNVLKFEQLRHLHHFGVMAALATAFSYFTMAKGTALLPSSIAGVLGGSPALFTSVASVVLLRNEKMNGLMVSGVALGMAGIALIARPWDGFASGNAISGQGIMWMLAGSVAFGLSYIYVRRFLVSVNLPSLAIVTWQMGLALGMLLFSTDMTGASRILEDWRATTGLVVGLGLLGTGVAFLLYYYLLDRLGAVAASGAVYVAPVVSLIIGRLVGERVGALEFVAVLIIFSGLALLEFGRTTAERRKESVVTSSALSLD